MVEIAELPYKSKFIKEKQATTNTEEKSLKNSLPIADITEFSSITLQNLKKPSKEILRNKSQQDK